MAHDFSFQSRNVEVLRNRLVSAVQKKGSFQDTEVLKISSLLDEILNQEMGIGRTKKWERFSSVFARPCDR